ncbi:MAG: ribbon-helix-helix domain-containing protein [Proteobacteria bacterium]|nr:ribbon-helix-helix domain-containing protein [Pseudomonadota bacterium]
MEGQNQQDRETGGFSGVLRKRSVVVAGHRTSVSLEDAFWTELRRIAVTRGHSLNQLVTEVDRARPPEAGNLSSALRLFVLESLRAPARMN